MRNTCVRFCNKLFQTVRVVIGLLLTLSVLLNFANVIGRYVLHAPIAGAEEVMLYLMIAIVFLGFGTVAWEGRHIKIASHPPYSTTFACSPNFQRSSSPS